MNFPKRILCRVTRMTQCSVRRRRPTRTGPTTGPWEGTQYRCPTTLLCWNRLEKTDWLSTHKDATNQVGDKIAKSHPKYFFARIGTLKNLCHCTASKCTILTCCTALHLSNQACTVLYCTVLNFIKKPCAVLYSVLLSFC